MELEQIFKNKSEYCNTDWNKCILPVYVVFSMYLIILFGACTLPLVLAN